MTALTPSQAGFQDPFTINGTDLPFWPTMIDLDPEIQHAFFRGASAKLTEYSPWVVGTPDVEDLYRIALICSDMSDNDGTLLLFLEELRKKAGPHTFAVWKPEILYYTATAAQAVFYLLRKNAPSALGQPTGHTETDNPMTVTVNGVARTVVCKDTLTEATSVTTGEWWVHRSSRLTKTEPPLSAGDVVRIQHFPLFSVFCENAKADYPQPSLESRTFHFIESRD